MKFLVSFIIKFVIILIFIFLLGIVGLNLLIKSNSFQKPYKYTDYQLIPTHITEKEGIECVRSGGDWRTSPLGNKFFCNKKFDDGGKPCSNSSECLSSKCIIYKGNSVAECATHESVFGCYSILSKSRAKDVIRREICVD